MWFKTLLEWLPKISALLTMCSILLLLLANGLGQQRQRLRNRVARMAYATRIDRHIRRAKQLFLTAVYLMAAALVGHFYLWLW